MPTGCGARFQIDNSTEGERKGRRLEWLINASRMSLPKRDGPDIETVLADGTLVATDVNVCSPYSSCWINHTKF